jgi:hypothetical protein
MFLSEPRGFRDPAVVAARRAMLETVQTVQPLRAYSADLMERRRLRQPTIEVPDFDPADAGVEARVLLVFEAPGDRTVATLNGSGFISSDNDDESARAIWTARNDEGMHTGVASWNIVPWFLGPGDVAPGADEVRQGALELRRLLPLFDRLEAVVLCGLRAQAGWNGSVAPHLDAGSVRVIETWNPAPRTFAQKGKKDQFLAAMHRAAAFTR